MGDRRCIAFRCIRCRNPFRERVQKLVRQGRAACDSCCASVSSRAEEMVVEHTKAVMQRLQRQGVVRCFQVTKNQKLTKAEIASVAAEDGVSAPLPRWNVTVTAKVGTADDGSAGIQTQLLHIEVTTAAVKDAAATKMMMIKDTVVKAAATSAYGARFKKVGLLRVVSPQVEEEEEEEGAARYRVMLSEVKAFVVREFG